KGFTLDDERLKQGGTRNVYFDELLQRIREIRLSERNFYRKICDIYQTSIDYDPSAEMTQRFFQTVQNKMHWATHGHTAAEVIHARRCREAEGRIGVRPVRGAPPSVGGCQSRSRVRAGSRGSGQSSQTTQTAETEEMSVSGF